jgi:HAD superfamily hydrolase (TIGR01509 family)
MRAAIFDLDGTIVDNMPVHAEAFSIFAQRHGLASLSLDDRKRLDGRRNKEIFPDLFGRALTDEEQVRYADEKEALYRELSAGRLEPVNGLIALLDRLDAHRIPVAIATSAPPENVIHTLAELRLDSRITRIVRGDQVPRGKPFPDVFLAAAERLGVAPRECVAFEDAPVGVAAARAAGMKTVAVANSFTPEVFLAPSVGADCVVRDFADYLAGPGRWLTAPAAPPAPPPA